MTESEWLVSDDPQAMLRWMVASGIPAIRHARLTDRKLRLFACAVCRQVWDGKRCGCLCGKVMVRELPPFEPAIEPPTGPVVMPEYRDRIEDCPTCHGTGRVGGLTDPRSRAAVEVAERYADGEATEAELAVAREALPTTDDPVFVWQGQAVINCVFPDGWRQAEVLSEVMAYHKLVPPATQAALLRDLVNPWHTPDLSWVRDEHRWFAETVYRERRFELLPIFADQCEEAGCTDAVFIGHLRSNGVHCRGCWCVDAVLGKS